MINKAVKLLRQYHEMTQTELASQLSISKSYLSELESGKKPISFELLQKYSLIFDIEVSSLVFFSESLSSRKGISEKFRANLSTTIIKLMDRFIDNEVTEKIKA